MPQEHLAVLDQSEKQIPRMWNKKLQPACCVCRVGKEICLLQAERVNTDWSLAGNFLFRMIKEEPGAVSACFSLGERAAALSGFSSCRRAEAAMSQGSFGMLGARVPPCLDKLGSLLLLCRISLWKHSSCSRT